MGSVTLCLGGKYVMKARYTNVKGEEKMGVFEVLRSRILSYDIIEKIKSKTIIVIKKEGNTKIFNVDICFYRLRTNN